MSRFYSIVIKSGANDTILTGNFEVNSSNVVIHFYDSLAPNVDILLPVGTQSLHSPGNPIFSDNKFINNTFTWHGISLASNSIKNYYNIRYGMGLTSNNFNINTDPGDLTLFNMTGPVDGLSMTTVLQEPIIMYPMCFPSGTPVQTDQGLINIEKINSSVNTIRGKNIVAITKTVTIEDKIVCIEKDALGLNIPSQKTYISRNHELLYNKQMIKAKNLIGVVDGVYNKKYNGEILYNVLLDKHDKMVVNNLIVETLDPENIVAKLYNGNFTMEEKNNIIVNLNNGAKEYKKQFGKIL